MNIADWIVRWAEFTPDKVAIGCDDDDTLTYKELAGRIARTTDILKHALGVSSGDRVAHLGYNSPEMLILFFACARLGAIFAPLNWRLSAAEHRFILEDAGAELLFVDEAHRDAANALRQRLNDLQLVSVDSDLPANGWLSLIDLLTGSGEWTESLGDRNSPLLLVYTSGTTGRAKGVVLSQSAIEWNAVNSSLVHNLTSDDHVLTTLPLCHVGGLNIQTVPALHAGASVTLQRRFDAAAFLGQIAGKKITLSVLVPDQMEILAGHDDWAGADLASLRLVATGSHIFDKALTEPWSARDIPVINIYGLTETAPIAIHQSPGSAVGAPEAIGHPAVHCEIRIANSDGGDVSNGEYGEILVRGPNLMLGYWRDDDATTRALVDGWLHTGDVGRRQRDGTILVADRLADVIRFGDEKIYPTEIEALLRQHKAVVDVAVVGTPHKRWGEVPVAVIACKTKKPPAAEKLLAELGDRFPESHHPRKFFFVDSMPRGLLGTIQKFELRNRIARGTIG